MIPSYRSTICTIGSYMQSNLPLTLGPINYIIFNNSFQQVRYIKKHWNPKFRKERARKVMKIKLPDFEETKTDDDIESDKIRTRMKEWGILPQRNWNERPVLICSTPQIFQSYVVPEGDGKFSAITSKGAKQRIEILTKKSKSYLALRKIKSYEENYTNELFIDHFTNIYKAAHEALCKQNKDEMLQYVTENAYPMMIHNMENKTIVWKFLESLEPARIVHARVASVLVKHNEFAQVTVRFHTQQLLCIYDRFGRVLLGSETVKKDVLDYIVFEKHLTNVYGIWRIHGKIIPDWMKLEEIPSKTYILPKEKKKLSPSDDSAESIVQVVPPETLEKEYTDKKV
ncbi:putative 39S ribosomal protein L45, mitochondrial [Eufriesea mexicana]|uniref:Large ribosomal subunit protein mL45 n=1 Tax=Eufriesea mexicana TaxID=516756 RepID=A0A310SDU2_9HYME|nr:PREDICTED: probable 39S ribosomal protein L45, mitochondrial [Eufriesea mexicana]OAD53156.1 putative 39S ribosomal protein L45, mitochondrial [Eufriesea mexicana]